MTALAVIRGPRVTCDLCHMTGPPQDSYAQAAELAAVHDQLQHPDQPAAEVTP